MFSFFQTIFAKITSAVASIIIAAGLVSAPVQQLEPPQQVRIITEAKEEPGIEVEQASSTISNSTSFPTPTLVKISKATTRLAKPKSSTFVPEGSSSSVSTTSQSSSAIIESSKASTSQPITTLSTALQQTLAVVTQQESTTVTIEELKITSSKITPDRTSVTIEWYTNKPTQSRAFIWNGSFNKVYQSESGLSTRHFVNASGLSAGTNYSYELESIAGEQVARKQDSFSTLPEVDKSEIVVTVKNNGFSSRTNLTAYSITVSILDKNGKYLEQAPFHWDWPEDDSDYIFYKNKLIRLAIDEQTWLAQKSVFEDRTTPGTVYYSPTTPGIKTLTFTSGSLSKTITVEPSVTIPISHQVINIVTNSPLGAALGYQKIGSFELTASDVPDLVTSPIYETNIPDAGNNLSIICDRGNCGGSEYIGPSKTIKIEVYTGTSAIRYIPVGSYYITIKSLSSVRQILGLPVTFNFTVASSTSQ